MRPETYKALLKDLQGLQKKLVPAYVAAVRGDARLAQRVAERHAAAEVGGSGDDFVKLCARRSAVQLLLRTVMVRVLEDLGALTPPRIRGERGLAVFRDVAPGLGVREHLAWTFRDLAVDFPDLFTPGPDELPLPSEALCRQVWDLWHRKDGADYVYRWTDGDFDSRFLGDLYQDLDRDIRKRYALLQTPEFVESYILDHTLTPALEVFDPVELRERGGAFRVLDPTCGSGHFTIGSFRRMADFWEAQGFDAWTACELALASVWGCDINPHAVAIAAFRLLLEVRARTGVTDLERLASLPLNLRAMDSLVPWERLRRQEELFPASDRLSIYATAEEREANAEFLDRDFHVVVGNPPYITPKDKRKRDDYRGFWPDSAAGKYALSAPFCERFFVLGASGAFSGQITSNSFMKREFGKKLVQTVLPRWDLAGVIDTSGAYIPGHGTPTVILLGRSQVASGEGVWAVLGKRGEPARPQDPASGEVWSAIVGSGPTPSDASPYITSAQLLRATLGQHPWSLAGGGAQTLKAAVEDSAAETLLQSGASLGLMTKLIQDDIYLPAPSWLARLGESCVGLIEGSTSRDWAVDSPPRVPFPYPGAVGRTPASLDGSSLSFRFFWPFRGLLWRRRSRATRFAELRTIPGSEFYEYPFYYDEPLTTLTAAVPSVATHAHFALSRHQALHKETAPAVYYKRPRETSDLRDLIGLLNSSTLGFWMRQVLHDKGNRGEGGGICNEEWERFFVFDATKLKKAPLVAMHRDARIGLATALDTTAGHRAACLPAALLASDWTATDLTDGLATARARYRALTERMVALQEELDWQTYNAYGLLDADLSVPPEAIEPLAPGHRPFEIAFARADHRAPPEEKSAWWSRHGHDRVSEIPDRYSPAHQARLQQRLDLIASNERIALLEQPAYKRRWQTPDLDAEAVKAAASWLLDRLEDLFAPATDDAPAGPLSTPRPYRLEEVVDAWKSPKVEAVVRVWRDRREVDLSLAAEELLRAHALPDNPRRLYTPEGLRKLDQWKRVWHLQDLEDAGQPLVDPDTGENLDEIPLPPKFTRGDFARTEYFKVRGKLNVPRERFILFGELAPQRYGWNGWRDQERALAQVEAYTLAEDDTQLGLPAPTAEDPRRCGATFGLWESLPDLKRWGDVGVHAELEALAQEVCRQPRCPCALVERWEAWTRGELEVVVADADGGEVSVEERGRVASLLQLGPQRADELALRWPGSPARLERVLDDLVASGDLEVTGRGRRRLYRRTRS